MSVEKMGTTEPVVPNGVESYQGDVGEGLFVSEVLERRDHVGLEVVPAEAKLLLITLGHFRGCCSDADGENCNENQTQTLFNTSQ